MFRKTHGLLVVGIVLCLAPIFLLRRDPSEPNLEVVMERQMARTPAFGSYSPNPNFADNLTLRRPVPGTIAQGMKTFPYESNPEGAKKAGEELKNPLSHGNPQTRQRGALLYANYCQFCHGEGGLGDGPVSRKGFPAPLSFLGKTVLDMPDGEMFHIIALGKGNMPAHAMQLSELDRWAVILHVRVLQKKFTGSPNVRLADTINRFRRGEMDLRTAKTIGHLSALMLNALKQQAQQQRAAAIATTEAGRAAESGRAAQATRGDSPAALRHAKKETVPTPIIAARELDQLHPAMINGNAVNATDSGGMRIR